MSPRQQKILEIIVKEYVKNPKPVSSEILAQKLGLSSATLRNEMMELERLGYLSKPHTSAGRIPTEKGYRAFIKLLDSIKISKPEISQKGMRSVLGKKNTVEDSFRDITKTLAEMSGGLAFSGIKELNSFFQFGLSNLLKEPEWDDKDYFSEMAGMMEEFEKHFSSQTRFDELFKEVRENETKVFIGKENPLGHTKRISIIISKCKMPDKKHGVIGLLGPTRMRYDYNISLINKLRELLENYD